MDKDDDKGVFWKETLLQADRYKKERGTITRTEFKLLEISKNKESWKTCFYLKEKAVNFS